MTQNLDHLRILVIMPSIPLYGMERANIQIMKLMRNAGAEVLFVAEKGWGEEVVDAIHAAGCDSVAIKLGRHLTLPKNPAEFVSLGLYWLRIHRQIRTVFRNFQPTHLYLTNLSFFLFALPLAGRSDIRTVFRLPNPPEIALSGWKQRLSDWVWRSLVLPNCDYVVCNSKYTRSCLQPLCPPGLDVRVIYNTVPLRPAKKPTDAPLLDSSKFNVVYLGSVRRSKGVEQLYLAARILVWRYPDIDFYFAGENSWQNPFAEELMAETAREGLDNRIRFLGHINDTFGLLSQADIHVCPSTSRQESFPNVLLEAKQSSLPSVVFDTSGLPEAVVHEKEGIVCTHPSVDALVEGIERYLHSSELRERHGQEARRSLERYEESDITNAWIRVFSS